MTRAARVLVVDDEPNVRLVFRTALVTDGYEVTEAGDGKDALALLQTRPFDAVVLDLRMPGVDGMELLRRLAPGGVRVPVVVVSAHGSIPDVVEALRLGAVDFLPKPLAPETLRRVVRAAVESGRGPSRQAVRAGNAEEEDLARARQAIERGDCDEADFFLRVADALGVDPTLTGPLGNEVAALRRRQGIGPYRVVGGLTWD